MNAMLVAVKAGKQEVTFGADTVSGLMLADYFEGVSRTPNGWQKLIENGLEYTRN